MLKLTSSEITCASRASTAARAGAAGTSSSIRDSRLRRKPKTWRRPVRSSKAVICEAPGARPLTSEVNWLWRNGSRSRPPTSIRVHPASGIWAPSRSKSPTCISHQLPSRGRRGVVRCGVCDLRAAETYLTVRRAARCEQTPQIAADRRPQQEAGEICGLDAEGFTATAGVGGNVWVGEDKALAHQPVIEVERDHPLR